jgi:hypothetical protein
MLVMMVWWLSESVSGFEVPGMTAVAAWAIAVMSRTGRLS